MTQSIRKPEVQKTTPARQPDHPKRKHVQEKIMGILTLAFFGGVIFCTLFPEGHPARGASIGTFSILICYLLMKYAI